jgi:hypothetical protein
MTSDRDAVHTLLARCARPTIDPAAYGAVAAAAGAIADWSAVVGAADYHGLTSILYAHARDGAVPMPIATQRLLAAQYAMHRHENSVRLRELGRVLRTFAADGIPVIVLKGPALISLVYHDPGLRPMVDVDLLLPADQLIRAQGRLRDLGYAVWLPASDDWRRYKHHLPPAVRRVDDVTVQVELHWDAISRDRGGSLGWNQASAAARTIDVDGVAVNTLGLGDMLWHLCRHLAGLQHPFRLIWFADIVGLTCRFSDDFDWPGVVRRYPDVRQALALIDLLTPLDRTVRQRVDLPDAAGVREVGVEYLGWPRHRRGGGQPLGRAAYVAGTLVPPDWWLRFNYGSAPASSAARARLRHWTELLRHAVRRRHAARAHS